MPILAGDRSDPSMIAVPPLGVLGSHAERKHTMDEDKLLERITVNPGIFGGKPIIRGRRLAVEHVLAMLAAGDNVETICQGYPWLEPDDVRACLVYARRVVGHERVVPSVIDGGT